MFSQAAARASARAEGYATSSKYVENIMRIVSQNDLRQYDVKGETGIVPGYDYQIVQNQVNGLLKESVKFRLP